MKSRNFCQILKYKIIESSLKLQNNVTRNNTYSTAQKIKCL